MEVDKATLCGTQPWQSRSNSQRNRDGIQAEKRASKLVNSTTALHIKKNRKHMETSLY